MRNVIRASVAALALGFLLGATSQEISESTGATVEAAEHETYGAYLTDAQGLSLYVFLNDREGTSYCDDSCAETWPPLVVEGEPDAGGGITAELLGTTERQDGSTQVTYNDLPLYYFADDKAAGDINGQGTGAVWFLVTPEGEVANTEVEETGAEEITGNESEGGDSSAATSVNSVQDGAYTEAQAQQGNGVYGSNCEECHGSNLRGGQYAPPLVAGPFMSSWGGRTVGELFEYTRTKMPLGNGGSLSDQQYIDVVAFILQANEFPAGEGALVPELDVLEQIAIEP